MIPLSLSYHKIVSVVEYLFKSISNNEFGTHSLLHYNCCML